MISLSKILPLLILFTLLSSATADTEILSQSHSTVDGDDDGEFVMGRMINSTFEYEVEELEPVQVSFIIDDTGSMGSQIDGIKNNIKSFFQGLGSDARGSIVTFKDSASVDQTFTTSENTLESSVNSISAGGGADCEEDASGGLSNSLNNLNWQSGQRKIMILVVGAGVHSPSSIKNMADTLDSQGYKVFTVTDDLSCGGYNAVANDLPDTTGGSHYSFGTDWDKILDDISQEAGSGASGQLHPVYNDQTHSFDTFTDSNTYGDVRDYTISGLDLSGGIHSEKFVWRPTFYGNYPRKTGQSYIRIQKANGNTVEYDFSSSNQMDVKYVDFAISDHSLVRKSSDGTVRIKVEVTNSGNTASKPRKLWIRDQSGSTKIERQVGVLDPGESQQFDISFSSSNSLFSDNEPIYAHIDPKGLWDSTSYGDGKTLEPNEGNNRVELGYPSQIVSSFDPSQLDHPDWNREFQTSFNVEHYSVSGVDGTYSMKEGSNLEIDGAQLNEQNLAGNQRKFLTSQIVPNEAERWYNFTFRLRDANGATSVYEKDYYVENPPPVISNPDPEDDGYAFRYPVDISALVEDRNNDSVDVSFYNANDGTLIGDKLSVADENRIGTDWKVRDLGQMRWRIEVYDGVDRTVETFSFEKVIGSSFRVQPTIEYEYGSLVTSHKNTKVVPIKVTNLVDYSDPRRLFLNLSGVNSRFQSNGKKDIAFELGPGESERFLAEVTPNSPSNDQEERELTVTTRNRNFNTKTVKKLPVLVTSSNPTSPAQEVPGIGTVQLFFIMLVSGLLYSARL
ncbi:MAG: VWA domain-containing protein [Nanohaloarchaea archaeon]|nr:VWA domain-containing protein [Candidatus Nanohaloarchaea archaeon]